MMIALRLPALATGLLTPAQVGSAGGTYEGEWKDGEWHGMGAFSGTGLEAWLSRHGVRNLLLAGGAYTINTTMRQASDRGFDTLIVADCVQAVYSPNLYGVTASIIRGLFSATAHSDAVIQWCEQRADSEELGGPRKRARVSE